MLRSLSGWLVLTTGHAAGVDPGFVALLALAGLGSAVVAGLALAALLRRRSRSYLLVALALSALLARTGVAALTVSGAIDPGAHHLLEHGLDAAMAALVVGAVYDARSARKSAAEEDRSGPIRPEDAGVQPNDAGGERR